MAWIPLLVLLYGVLSILLLWSYEKTRLFPLYVLKVGWVSFTILAFVWVLVMSGGKSAEYIQRPTGPMTIVVGQFEKNADGKEVLAGGYRGALEKYTRTTPFWVLAALFTAWATWGLTRKHVHVKKRGDMVEEQTDRPAPWPLIGLSAAFLAAMLFYFVNWRDGAAFSGVAGLWIGLTLAVPNFISRRGHWLLLGLLALLALPLLDPILSFDWGRYRYFRENYQYAWNEAHIGEYFMNSMIVTITTVAVTTLFGAMAAYTIARRRFMGRSLLYGLIIGSIAIPGILIQVPLFLLIKDWGFDLLGYSYTFMDSRLGLAIIYAGISLPFTIFVLVGFFRTLPGELGESAYIDGCGPWRTFTEVYLPLAMPGIATTGIFNFLGAWNEFNLGMIFMSNPNFKTLPIGLYELQAATQYSAAWAPMFAGIVLLCLPTFLIFVFLQERIVAGLTAGGVKE